jgi:hypothetical protein
MVTTEIRTGDPRVNVPLWAVIAALHGWPRRHGRPWPHCDLHAAKAPYCYPEVKHGVISGVSALRLGHPERVGDGMLLMA